VAAKQLASARRHKTLWVLYNRGSGSPSFLNIHDSIVKHLRVKVPGWTGRQIVPAPMLLNMAGGGAVGDIDVLEKKEGFSKLVLHNAREGTRTPMV
jgi:hypothetical protein